MKPDIPDLLPSLDQLQRFPDVARCVAETVERCKIVLLGVSFTHNREGNYFRAIYLETPSSRLPTAQLDGQRSLLMLRPTERGNPYGERNYIRFNGADYLAQEANNGTRGLVNLARALEGEVIFETPFLARWKEILATPLDERSLQRVSDLSYTPTHVFSLLGPTADSDVTSAKDLSKRAVDLAAACVPMGQQAQSVVADSDWSARFEPDYLRRLAADNSRTLGPTDEQSTAVLKALATLEVRAGLQTLYVGRMPTTGWIQAIVCATTESFSSHSAQEVVRGLVLTKKLPYGDGRQEHWTLSVDTISELAMDMNRSYDFMRRRLAICDYETIYERSGGMLREVLERARLSFKDISDQGLLRGQGRAPRAEAIQALWTMGRAFMTQAIEPDNWLRAHASPIEELGPSKEAAALIAEEQEFSL